MKTVFRWIAGIGGLVLLGILATHADWSAVGDIFGRVGWMAPLVLVPYLAVYAVDTVAWSVMLPVRGRPGYGVLFRVRWAGEAVNNLVPTAYVGGEAVKVFLLRRHGVSGSDGAVAALVSKTAQTLAQVVFILLGALLFAQLAPGDSTLRTAMGGIVVLGMVGTACLVAVQRRGVMTVVEGVMTHWPTRVRWFEDRKEHFRQVDRQIRDFYSKSRGRFLLGTTLFLLGWLLDAVEIFVLGRLMEVPIGWREAVAIEAFIGVAKVLGLLVPGAAGVQETGVVFLCRLAGLPDVFGYAYAVWRRAREVLFAATGWVLLHLERTSLREVRQRQVLAE